MWIFKIILLILLDDIGTYGQILFGQCPKGWESHGTRCYKFEINNKRILEEADAECWTHGARLLSVSGDDEHRFVATWLEKHDSSHPTATWFTSGEYKSGIITWDDESDNRFINGLQQQDVGYWHDKPSPDNPYTRIAYVFRGGYLYNDFAWDLVSSSTPSAYICEIDRKDFDRDRTLDRDFQYGQGIIDPLDIEKGPVIIAEPKSVVIFRNVKSAYIECGAFANPHPGFSWRRDQTKNVTSRSDNRYTISGGRFTIQNPNEYRDGGSFQCVASNKYGSVLSQPAEFIFGKLEEFSPVRPDDVRVNKFEGTRIKCQAPAAFPDATYRWYTDTIDDYIFPEMYPQRFISQSGYLYFSEVQPTDHRYYKCVVTLSVPVIYNQASQQPPSRTSLGMWLIVSGTERGRLEPVIYTHIFPKKAIRGTRIRLECIAYGSLPLTYRWSREGDRPFAKGTTIEDQSRVLTIDNAQLDAEGNYICDVVGKWGWNKKTISLSIEASPYFPFGIGNKFVDPGQSLKWRCKAVARPKATYAWYKNGQLIEKDTEYMQVRGNYIYLKNIDKDRDEGMYQCSATNMHGTAFGTGQLKVLSFKPTFGRHPLPPTTLAPLGGNVTIPCVVEAAPIPQVEWLKNGGIISVIPGDITGRIGMTLKNTLVLREISHSDQGIYMCKASNALGEAINQTRLQVIRGIAITTAPMPTQARVNTTAFLYCQAAYDSVNNDLTYVWLFNGHKIDFHNNPHFVQSTKEGLSGMYIRQAQFKHAGVYTCQAKTALHTESRSAVLSVTGPPGPPAGVYVDQLTITPYSVRLQWTTGVETDHGNPIHSYDVEAEIHHYPGRWLLVATDVPQYEATNEAVALGLRSDMKSAVVEGLFPNIGYRFRVRAINDFGRGMEASKPTVTIKTPSTAPVSAPEHVRGGGGKVGTLTIEWKALDIAETCGPGLGYNVYFKRKDDPKDWFKAVVHGREEEKYTHVVGPEFYYLQYEVKVGTFNDHGGGPNSSVVVVYSAEGMPVARPVMGDCSNYNGSAIHMTWTPVPDDREHMKGRVKGYKIQYRLLDDDPDADYIWNRDVYGQQEEAIIIGLRDNTNYWVRVQVYNNAGLGPIGEWRLAETFHLPPIDYPRHVTVYSHTPHSVIVKWQGIITKSWHEESLQGYIVRVWKIQEDIRTATDTITDKRTEVVVGNLQMRTVYVLRVLGYSIGGEGALSPHVYFTVGGGRIPFDPSTTKYCFDDRKCDDSASSLHISYLLLIVLVLLSVLTS